MVGGQQLQAAINGRRVVQQTARLVLISFLMTFATTRSLVLLIMSQRLPNLYMRIAGTHVHHLNYGICMMSIVGAFLLFRRPRGRERTIATILYGIALGLTFDEFGMWLHLGGSYWQRASIEAVVVIAALLGLIWCVPSLAWFRPRSWTASAIDISLAVAQIVLARVHRVVPKTWLNRSRVESLLTRLSQAARSFMLGLNRGRQSS